MIMIVDVQFLSVVFEEEVVVEGGNGGVFPEVGKVWRWGDGVRQDHITFVGFTLVDEPDPPLMKKQVLNHKFIGRVGVEIAYPSPSSSTIISF